MGDTKKTFRTDALLLIQSLPESDAETGREVQDRVVEDGLLPSGRTLHFRLFGEDDFKSSLKWILEAINEGKFRYPCIQIDCHGSNQGLHLRDGAVIIWSRVQDFMNQILKATDNNLLVVLGACHGSFFIQQENMKYVPCSVLVSSRGRIDGSTLSERLVAFYSALFETGKTSQAMERLNDQRFKGHGDFEIHVVE